MSQPREIQTATDFSGPLRQLYRTGLRPGASTGFPSLDPHFTVRPGEWTLLTGIPSHGKSTFLDAVMVNLSAKHRWRWLVFSAENMPHERHAALLMSQFLGKPFGAGIRGRMSLDEFEWCRMFVADHFLFATPPDEDCTIGRILQQAELLCDKAGQTIDGLMRGIDGIVIDPWNELDHSRPAGLSETEYISRCLTEVRRFCRTFKVHVFLVAHPAKLARIKAVGRDGNESEVYPVPTPYDVSGSAHWRNKADNCLCVWRDVMLPGTCEVHIQKIRFREVGTVGRVEFGFDPPTSQYIDKISGMPALRTHSELKEIAMRPSKASDESMEALMELAMGREPGEEG